MFFGCSFCSHVRVWDRPRGFIRTYLRTDRGDELFSRVWSCCERTCYRTRPGRDRLRSPWWRSPPSGPKHNKTLKDFSECCGVLRVRTRFVPGSVSCLGGSRRFSGSSGYTWERTSGRIWNHDEKKWRKVKNMIYVILQETTAETHLRQTWDVKKTKTEPKQSRDKAETEPW